jgi:hypothetical protein
MPMMRQSGFRERKVALVRRGDHDELAPLKQLVEAADPKNVVARREHGG